MRGPPANCFSMEALVVAPGLADCRHAHHFPWATTFHAPTLGTSAGSGPRTVSELRRRVLLEASGNGPGKIRNNRPHGDTAARSRKKATGPLVRRRNKTSAGADRFPNRIPNPEAAGSSPAGVIAQNRCGCAGYGTDHRPQYLREPCRLCRHFAVPHPRPGTLPRPERCVPPRGSGARLRRS